MGCMGSQIPQAPKEEQQANKRLERELAERQKKEQKIIKILLLGAGESGKSTIFKQMQILYHNGFTEYEKTTFRHVVRRNVLESMQAILLGVARFGYQLGSAEAERAAKFLTDLDPLAPDFWIDDIVDHIDLLWNKGDAAIASAYANRSELQVPDSAQYLFENVHRIGRPDYVPTHDDILRARLRTSGIVERDFMINNTKFSFVDVGGQRNERRKWIHCFDNVTAVLFVAAISEYDQVLYEDEKVNRLQESINVFDKVCNLEFFSKTSMILFLNKQDLFKQKIPTVPLSVCFPDFEPAADGNGVVDPNSDFYCEDAKEFIKTKFYDRNRQDKDIFPHYTCATDTKNVERVFSSCRKIIVKDHLERLGLYHTTL